MLLNSISLGQAEQAPAMLQQMEKILRASRPLITHAIAFYVGMNAAGTGGLFTVKPPKDAGVIGFIKDDVPIGRPFDMPIKDDAYEIFQPLYDVDKSEKNPTLFAPIHEFIETFEERTAWAESMVTKIPQMRDESPRQHAERMFFEMMKSHLTGTAYNDAEISVVPGLGTNMQGAKPFDRTTRIGGMDWTYAGETMVGWKRLDNIRSLLRDVVTNRVPGDYIETGVWRGGASIYARAVMNQMERPSSRRSYVCDSFRGLPPGDKGLHERDTGWDSTPYLEVPSSVVTNNFIKYGLLDSNVIFAKGFFNETMPPLSKQIQELAIMRLDGDIYESTVDVLYHLYDKLSVGGYVIMDDWYGFPSKAACEDFFEVHGINPEIVKIDDLSVYWKKTEQVDIQYWRYKQSRFKPEQVPE